MITLNQITKRFEEFAGNHFFVKSFSSGSPTDIDLDKFTDYPLLHVLYTGSSLQTGTKAMSFEVYVLDATSQTDQQTRMEREVVSDSEQCLEDLISDLITGLNIFEIDYVFDNGQITPLESVEKNVLCGAMLDISISVPFDASSCYAPIDGVDYANQTITYQRRGILKIREADGTPSVNSVRTIVVPNDSLTDDGNGQVTLDFATDVDTEIFKRFVNTVATGFVVLPDVTTQTYIGQGSNFMPVFTGWVVTGTLPVGFVLDPQSRWIDITGQSSNQRIIMTIDFDSYQDASAAIADVLLVTVRLTGSGNPAFSSGDQFLSFTQSIGPLPVGQPFAANNVVSRYFDILVYPDNQIQLLAGSLFGTVLMRLNSIEIDVIQV